ncbi:putative phospholipid-transporting ATPase DNF3 [Pseudocercospora fuligena]|uniref:Phospholipid-transporting ATPase n=1 Tax=Pseudocercospora fuligena TaxID=685502 RepID=A0A8H6VHR6_9PEZI|nr:putative phospholipid-transporting ATPase DNF3 [Pseudocercospora fuligena]
MSDANIRRRHSAHSEDSDGEIMSRDDDGVQTGVHEVDPRPSVEQRVRFSQDVEARAANKKRKSDEDYNGVDDRSKGPNLSVDTGLAQASGSAGLLGRSTVTSPESIPSSQSPVLSPRSRARGFSMRTSLFMRNMASPRSAEGHGSIELQDVGTSSGDRSATARPQTAKKDPRTSITVTPVDDVWQQSSSVKHSEALPRSSALPNYQQWMAKQARKHLPLRRMAASIEKVRKFVLRIQEIPPSKDGRHIYLDPSRKKDLIDERTNKPYISNLIRSSKYNAWNFVPRQLFAQFSKLANAYFLCVSILQMIPGLSTTGTYTTIVPLMFFVALSMGKEGYEDLRRHRLDKAENNDEAKVLHVYKPVAGDSNSTNADSVGIPMDGPMHWAPVKWQSLRVGDVVKLERDDTCPADLVLLSAKGPNNTAYIETMALDGETNLKPKQPSPETIEAAMTIEDLATAELEFVVEDPNLDLYSFEGRVTVNGKTSPLTNNEVIYRGSVLRNTPECIGIVAYSGEECKIRMNANKNPRIKAPALQAVVNKIVIAMVFFVLFLALFNSIAYQVWQDTTESKSWYVSNAEVSFGPLFTSFIIMFNTLIPLSLYVSLEIIKVSQMVLMNDIDMYDPESNTPFEARTSTINEELGQIGYIFSDKTGTLTENVMKFRKLSVAGSAYLHDIDLQDQPKEEIMLHKKRSKGKKAARKSRKSTSAATSHSQQAVERDQSQPRPSRASTSQWRSSAAPEMMQTEQNTLELIQYLQQRPQTPFSMRARMLILSMAVCHTCLPERVEEDDDDSKISFQASSPDELALVRAAQELGYLAYERDAAILKLKLYPNGMDEEPVYENYEILDVIEFSSKRKRMSVLVRLPDGKIVVICKGADSVIMKRLRLASIANQKLAEIEKRTIERKSMEAQEALRRKSSIAERAGSVTSMPRTSNSLARRSTTIGRASMGRLDPIRDDVDGWLNQREHDVSPRVSSHFRPSMSERQGSLHTEHGNDHFGGEANLSEDVIIERCLQHINDFATEGLRTLLYGHRFLSEDEYRSWKKIYHDATTSLVNRTELIEKAGDMIEQHLELGGATAIEDKLQKGVPETIDRLRRANIKMWMLTGDKRETAINIGHSCRLIKDYSAVTVLDYEAGDVEQNIAASIIDINRGGIAHSVVVIDGQTLAVLQSDEALHTLFLDLAILADSVICCRASPSQKAGLVNAIRMRVNKSVTLAIGDGANDIAMIQEAHVGIGITGKEGLQAARTSDYSIAQFRFLTKLLLVHGRWNYIRTCKYTAGTFFKEMLFYLTQALYQRYNGYSGTSLYESWSLSMFNTLFTSLTIIFLGIFEQDLRASTLIAVPELYTKGQRALGFNLKVFIGWMFMAVSEAVIIFFTMWGLYGDALFSAENTIFPLGNMTFTACVILIAIKLQIIEQRYKSYMAAVAVIASVGGWFLWNIILSALYAPNLKYNVKLGLFSRFGKSGLWWLTLLISIVACCLLEIGARALKCAFMPTDTETFQTLEQDLDVRKRFEEASAPWMQQGWNHGIKKSSLELERQAEQEKREFEVEQLLSRPRTMEAALEAGNATSGIEREEQTVFVADGLGRSRTDISAMLSRRFGLVKRETMTTSS